MIIDCAIKFKESWELVVTVLYIPTLIYSLYLSYQVILDNKPPQKTISWLLVLILLPVVGMLMYVFLGQNFRKEKIFSQKGIGDFYRIEQLKQQQLLGLHKLHSNPNWKDFTNENIRSKLNVIKLMLNNSKALLSENNKVSVLNNGSETFTAIIEALNQAKDHIHLEYYIIEDDDLGNRIKNILIKKAREGVKVRLIYDDVGSWNLNDLFIKPLTDEGVEVYGFMPVKFPRFTSKINYRNHRKIIVVDGTIGFVGGLNIADRYLYGEPMLGFWRDTHLRIEGDAVKGLQTVFLIDWHFVSKQHIRDYNRYFPTVPQLNTCFVQIIASGPDSDWASIMHAYFAAVATAKKYIYISTPYFVPNESILTAMKTTAMSGVDVRMILPDYSDSHLVLWSTKSYISELLEAGIKIYLYQYGFIHSKLFIVDDILSSVGTANLDVRSLDQNFEVNAIVYNELTARELKKYFIDDLTECKRITSNGWALRSREDKIKESFARVFSPLL